MVQLEEAIVYELGVRLKRCSILDDECGFCKTPNDLPRPDLVVLLLHSLQSLTTTWQSLAQLTSLDPARAEMVCVLITDCELVWKQRSGPTGAEHFLFGHTVEQITTHIDELLKLRDSGRATNCQPWFTLGELICEWGYESHGDAATRRAITKYGNRVGVTLNELFPITADSGQGLPPFDPEADKLWPRVEAGIVALRNKCQPLSSAPSPIAQPAASETEESSNTCNADYLDLVLDLENYKLRRKGMVIPIDFENSLLDWKIIRHMVKRRDSYSTYDALREIWKGGHGHTTTPTDKTIRDAVSRVNQKISGLGIVIKSRSKRFRLEVERPKISKTRDFMKEAPEVH